jgi:anthranilate synthase/aminodeoxychorismate synthase-like glutamine amidotransferase
MHHEGVGVFAGLPRPFDATRYHSLVIEPDHCPDCLEITARTEDGEIMGVRHDALPIEGVQFHPESILTEVGKQLLGNFLARCGPREEARA